MNMLHQIEVWRCFGAEAVDILWLLGVIQSARSPVIGHGTESTSSVMARGASLRIQEGAAEAQEACLAGWCQKSGLQNCCLGRIKLTCHRPRGALSWACLMVSRGTVIWGCGSNPSVVGGPSCIYMHIHAYTCIDLGRECIHAYMCIYCVTDRVSFHGEHHTCI
jgi:hypothetical protein